MSDHSEEEEYSNSEHSNENESGAKKKKGKKSKEEPKITYITKTRLKQEYLLTEAVLKKFEHVERPNPHRRYGPSMILYDKEEILAYLKEFHGADTEEELTTVLEELRKKKSEKSEVRKAKLKETKEKKKAERKERLVAALTAAGLELRGDSSLCDGYIEGTLRDDRDNSWDIDSIVKRMCEMKYLYEYCNFNEVYKECKKQREKERDYDREYGYRDWADDYRETIFEEAESQVLANVGGYPKVFPWQTSNQRETSMVRTPEQTV
jgi:hypothetical protein